VVLEAAFKKGENIDEWPKLEDLDRGIPMTAVWDYTWVVDVLDWEGAIVRMYGIIPRVAMAVIRNVIFAPNWNQISPAKELASMVQMLWNPENVPIAVAVSFLAVIVENQAVEISSVADGYLT